MARTWQEIKRRLDEGEWLLIGDVAILLGIDRKTVDRMLKKDPPQIRYEVRPGTGEYRECNPEDVRTELAKRPRRLLDHRGDEK